MEVLTQRKIDLVRASVDRIRDRTPYNFYLFHMVIALPLYMGCDQKTMIGLDVDDLDTKGTHFTVGPRTVPWHPETRKLVRKFIAYRAARLPDTFQTKQLLVKPNGIRGRGPSTNMNVNSTMLRQYYNEISTLSKVKVNPTILRDTHGYHLALQGAPVHVIMATLNCSYPKAMNCIGLASRTVKVDDWYIEALGYLRPYRDKP